MENENKVILGITFLYTVITGFFSLLGKVSILFTSNNLNDGLIQFGWRSFLWIVLIVGITIVLYRLNKKSNQSIHDMLSDRTITMATGVLVLIDGLIKIANLLPIGYMSIKLAIEVYKKSELYVNGMISESIIENGVSLTILLLQIILGILILRYHKKTVKQ